MIIVCEPNCRKFSHETFNLGFLYGLSLAYPDEKILFLSAESQKKTLQLDAQLSKIKLNNVRFQAIKTYIKFDFFNVIWNIVLMLWVLNRSKVNGARAIYFMSATQIQQRVIKHIAKLDAYSDMVFAINLHGEMDELAYPDFHRVDFSKIPRKRSLIKRMLYKKNQLPKLIFKKWVSLVSMTLKNLLQMTFPKCSLSATLLNNNSENVKYVCLSSHIRELIPQYIDIKKIHLKTITLPAIYNKLSPVVPNKYFKIAVFGYGHSAMLYKLNCELDKQDIYKDYEIRIIGMDARGTEEFPHTKQPIKRTLTRAEMEKLTQDIDMFLILYEKERYILSCSGSIIEAHSYAKPIVYLNNPCIDSFNTKKLPIGICCEDVSDMAVKLANIINKYEEFVPQLDVFRKNIIIQRNLIDIRNNLDVLKSVIEK